MTKEQIRHSAAKTVIYCLIVCAVGALCYANALQGEFVFDDLDSLISRPEIKLLDPVLLWRTFNIRALGYLTFALNYKFAGFDPFWFHFINVAIHLANACLVFFLTRLVMENAFRADASRIAPRYVEPVALTAALIFVAHPVQTQAVTFIVQRLASLVATFYLLSVICFFKGRERMETGERRGWLFISASLIAAVAAMFTKQNAFTIPIAFILVELSFFSPSWAMFKRKLVIFIPAFVLMGIIPMSFALSHDLSFDDIVKMAETMRDVGPHDYLATQVSVLVTYLRLIFVPIRQMVDYNYPIVSSFLNVGTILSLAFHCALWGIALASWKRNRPVFFGIFFFYVAMLVESSVFPISDVIMEHRIYLPSVGIIIAVSSLVWLAVQRSNAKQTSAWIAIGLIVAILSVLTHERNNVWANSLTLWTDNVEKDPSVWRAQYNLGNAYYRKNDYAEAKRHWLESAKLLQNPWALNNAGNVLMKDGHLDEAISMFKRAIEISPKFVVSYGNMGLAFEQKGDTDESIRLNEKAMSIDPKYAGSYFNIGRILYKKNELERSEVFLRKALELDPRHAYAHLALGMLLAKTGRVDEAKVEYKKALEIKPDIEAAAKLLKLLGTPDVDQK